MSSCCTEKQIDVVFSISTNNCERLKYIFNHQSGKNGFLSYGSEHNLKIGSLLKIGA
jgi:hypothetical protein